MPQLQRSVSHAPLGATVSDPETENLGKKGVRSDGKRDGKPAAWSACVRVETQMMDRNAEKLPAIKNLSRDDSSVSVCVP